MNVSNSFSMYMKANNILQKDIAELLKKTPQAISGIFNGKSDLTTAQLILICSKYKNLNVRWLLTGEGNMYHGYEQKETFIDVVNENQYCSMCREKDKRIIDLELHRDDLRRQIEVLNMGRK